MAIVTWYRGMFVEMSLALPLELAQRLVSMCISPVATIESGDGIIGYNIFQR